MRKVLTEGQNLRHIRKMLDINQNVVAGNKSREYVSDFERDKMKLSEHKEIAEEFASNINKYIDTFKSHMKHITVEQLTETEVMRANRFVFEITEDIKSKTGEFETLKEEGLNLIKVYGIKKEFQVTCEKETRTVVERDGIEEETVNSFYTVVADYYAKKYDYKSEQEYLLLRFALCFDSNKTLNLYDASTKLMCNSYYQCNYADVLRTGAALKPLVDTGKVTDPLRVSKLYYNTALAYKAEKQYDKALETIEEWETKIIIPEELKYHARTLKSNCMVLEERYSEALELYLKELYEDISLGGRPGSLANNYSNVAFAYLKQDNIPKAIEYIEKALELINHASDSYKLYIYYNALEIYSFLDNTEFTFKYFRLALEYAYKVKDEERVTTLIEDIFDYCFKQNLSSDMLELLDMFKDRGEEMVKYYYRVAAHYRKINKAIANDVFDKGLDILDKTSV